MPRLTFQETMDRLTLLIRAGYPVIYINSHEEARVFNCIARIVNRIRRNEDESKQLWRWYEGTGLEWLTNPPEITGIQPETPWLEIPGLPEIRQWDTRPHEKDAASALRLLGDDKTYDQIAELKSSVMVFFDLHPYLTVDGNGGAGSMVRPLRNTAATLRRHYERNRHNPHHKYNTLIIVAPSDNRLSSELDRDLIRLDFPLPESDELLTTLRHMTSTGSTNRLEFLNLFEEGSDKYGSREDLLKEFLSVCPKGENLPENERQQAYESRLSEMIANAGRGISLEDYRLGLNMFAVSGKRLSSHHINEMLYLKAKAINNRALEYTPEVKVRLGGLEQVKAWVSLRKDPIVSSQVRQAYHLPAPKGVMLCGVSGGGKSQLAKMIASEFKLALLRLDVGALFGSYVGESEARTQQALQLAEVLAPVVLWVDEIDKAFSSIGAGGDNGVSARVFGYFLTWLAEKQDNVFVVTTANDFNKLMGPFPEFGRKGRFDEIFWVDLPSETERREIFKIYLEKYLAKEGDKSYLTISDSEIDKALQEEVPAVRRPPQLDGGTTVERFFSLLSHDLISLNLTGAEIEYAVAESLYEAYKLDQNDVPMVTSKFTPSLLIRTVLNARQRALHGDGTKARTNLDKWRVDAQANNWIGSPTTQVQAGN